jgi:phage replication O-like protein O
MKNPSPQLENGYTSIANEIMDALIKFRIPGEERQCLDFIIRKTYGYHKKEDAISNSQFVDATGLKKGNVCRAIKSLVKKGVVIKIDNAVIKSDNKYIPTYRFNKDYSSWKVLSKKITLSKVITGVIKSDNKTLSKAMDTKDNKETIQKKIYSSDFLRFWQAYPNKTGKDAAWAAWRKRKDRPGIESILAAIAQQSLWRSSANGAFRPEWKNPSTWINQGCWADEVKGSQSKQSQSDTPRFLSQADILEMQR